MLFLLNRFNPQNKPLIMSNSFHFLIADDDPDDVALFRDVLNEVSDRVHITTASDGIEALEQLQTAPEAPGLIFLDLNMPRMGGKECLKIIKSEPSLSSIPVIIYTTSSQSRDIEEAMMDGAMCFITKPSSMKELRHILKVIVDSYPNDLQRSLRILSNEATTFIVSA